MVKHPLIFALLTAGYSLASADSSTLQSVKISAADQHSLSSELPSGSLILSQEDIAAMPARTLADVLDSVASINGSRLYGIDSSGTRLDLLGFGSGANQNTLLLLNGQRLSNVDLTTPDLSSIPLSAIERIEVLPNAGAALYGNGAVGGTINIITRQRYANSAGLSITGGSYDSRGGQAYAGGQQGDVSGLLSLGRFESDGYRRNNELQRDNVFADLRYQGDGYTAYLTTLGQRQEQGLPGGRLIAPGINELRDDPRGTSTPDDQADNDELHLMPGLRIRTFADSTLILDFAHREQTQEFFFSPSFDGKTRVQRNSATPRLEGQHSTGKAVHNWTLGFDLHDYDYRSRSSFASRDLQQRQQAWYLHDLIAVTPRLSVSAGARKMETLIRGDGQRQHQDGEMYEGGVRYTIDGGLALFAGAQRSVRIANLDELSPFNPPIDPQTGHGYSVGASWQEGRQHSTLTLWRARIDDEIIFDPASFSNRNLDDPTLHKGVSINSRWQLNRDFSLTINGALQQARFQDGPVAGNDVPLVPQQTLQLISDWQALPWLNARISHRYVGRRHQDSDISNDADSLSSYRNTDLQLTGRYRQAYLQVGVYNIEDAQQVDFATALSAQSSVAYPLPERHVMVTLGADF